MAHSTKSVWTAGVLAVISTAIGTFGVMMLSDSTPSLSILTSAEIAAISALAFSLLAGIVVAGLWSVRASPAQSSQVAKGADISPHAQAAASLVQSRLVQMIDRIENLPMPADRSEVHTALSRLPRLDDLPLDAFAALPDLASRMMVLEDLRHQAGIAGDPRRPHALKALKDGLQAELERLT
ncbi:MAG: hypothetical protein Alpg2KO_15090 [Alphaproteobacteria bacterium]